MEMLREAATCGYAAARYRSTGVRTSTAAELVVELHDAALSALSQALAASGASRGLLRAHALISELDAALDPSEAPDLCRELGAVYGFMLQRITACYVHGEPDLLAPVMPLLRELRAAWCTLASRG
jgi:flagellar biosynthetic protein FliS